MTQPLVSVGLIDRLCDLFGDVGESTAWGVHFEFLLMHLFRYSVLDGTSPHGSFIFGSSWSPTLGGLGFKREHLHHRFPYVFQVGVDGVGFCVASEIDGKSTFL